ncbi:hypothetical protein C8R47DRAFT_779346 [Mycena vitilis]|nr:hypothetical protein C8R47DRAFT_779346 [Mycena vitilis]
MFFLPSDPCSVQNLIVDSSTATILIDSRPIHGHTPVQSPRASSPTTSVTDGTSGQLPMSHLDDSSGLPFSSPLTSINEQSLPSSELPAPFSEFLEQPDTDHPLNALEDIPSDPTSAEPPMLEDPSTDSLTQTQTMPIVAAETTDTVMLPPSSSPLDMPISSPASSPAPPLCSSSETPTNDIRPPVPSSPFSLTHEDSNSNVSDSLPSSTTLYEPETANIAPLISPTTDSCSLPSSSPELIFSSSPLAASDSSVPLDDEDFTVPKSVNTHTSVDDTDLPSSSPPPNSGPPQIDDADSLNQDNRDAPPPSSSPMLSSSPTHMDLEEQLFLSIAEIDTAVFSSHTVFSSLSSVRLSGTLLASEEQKEDSSASVDVSSVGVSPLNQIAVNFSSGATDSTSQPPTSQPPMDDRIDSSGQKNDEMRTSHKRKREEGSALGEDANEEINIQPPNPKRPTLASQKLQRQTLVKPFRSPAMVAPKAVDTTPPPPPKKETVSLEQPAVKDNLKKHRTQRASGQFKSPLPLAVASSVPSAVRQTPTIQALERKVQILRRAVKVKNGGEEETLEALVKKWTEAGREIAWEVWALVKDNENGSGDDWGKDSQKDTSGKRRFEDSWGWNEDSGSKRVKVEESDRNWGWSASPVKAADDHSIEQPVEPVEEEEKPRETLGTMLARMGIAPSTLGWNDEEEEFVDE